MLRECVVDEVRVVSTGGDGNMRQSGESFDRQVRLSRHWMTARNNSHVFVFHEADAFESVTPVGQRIQREFHSAAVKLVEHMQRSARSYVKDNGRRQLRHPAYQPWDDRAGTIGVRRN